MTKSGASCSDDEMSEKVEKTSSSRTPAFSKLASLAASKVQAARMKKGKGGRIAKLAKRS